MCIIIQIRIYLIKFKFILCKLTPHVSITTVLKHSITLRTLTQNMDLDYITWPTILKTLDPRGLLIYRVGPAGDLAVGSWPRATSVVRVTMAARKSFNMSAIAFQKV